MLSGIKQKENPALIMKKIVALGSEIITAKKILQLPNNKKGNYMLPKFTSKVPTKDREKKKQKEEIQMQGNSKNVMKRKILTR